MALFESLLFTALVIVGAVMAILWVVYDFFHDLKEPK